MTAKITIKEYFAQAGTRFTDMDARRIGPQLQELAKQGDIDAQAIVDAAHSANSPLHEYFLWDDNKAANEYRKEQAEEVIDGVRVRFIIEDQEYATRAFKILVRQTGPGLGSKRHHPRHYVFPRQAPIARSAFSMDESPTIAAALRDLDLWRVKYRDFAKIMDVFRQIFQPVSNQIEKFIEDTTDPNANPDIEKAHGLIVELKQVLIAARDDLSPQAAIAAEFAAHFKLLIGAIVAAETEYERMPDRVREVKCLRCGIAFQTRHAGANICVRCRHTSDMADVATD